MTIALHGLPLPLVIWFANGMQSRWLGFGMGVAMLFSLAYELYRQRLSAHATKLIINAQQENAPSEWLLYRGDAQCGATHSEVQFLQQMDCQWFVFLLMQQQQHKFRLLLHANAQSYDQLHRFRLLMSAG